jgi:phage repressor protein C with HTH and peptisase S24 domain
MPGQEPTPLQERLKRALEAKGMKPRPLAEKAGLGPTAVRDILDGRSVSPKASTLKAIAQELGVSLEYLIGSPETAPLAPAPAPPTNAKPAPDAPPLGDLQRQVGPEDVPIYGTAQGGPDGWFDVNMSDGPLDYAPRPPGIRHDRSVFAVRVEGDSMSPWRNAGQLVYAARRPLSAGCHVVVLTEKGKGQNPRALLKRYNSQDNGWVHLSQYNPRAEISIEKADVWEIFRILEWEEVLGI